MLVRLKAMDSFLVLTIGPRYSFLVCSMVVSIRWSLVLVLQVWRYCGSIGAVPLTQEGCLCEVIMRVLDIIMSFPGIARVAVFCFYSW